MNNQPNHLSQNQFQDISSLPDVVQYVGLVSQLIEYSTVREQEETKRQAIKSHAEREITLIQGKLALMEKELLADKENLKKFVEDTMDAIPQLIQHGQFELIDKLHERVANNLQGRVSKVAETFNEYNAGGNVFFLEDQENQK
jgi:hypothetical protein